MAQESDQKWLGRVRTPRVHITYDVETGGAMKDKEIPFVVGVLADLSGQPKEPLPALEDRSFVEIDRDNIDDVLAKQKPRLLLRVPNRFTTGGRASEETELQLELTFQKLADFHPDALAKNIKPLQHLTELRNQLASLQNRLYGNAKLDELLQAAVQASERSRVKAQGDTQEDQ